MMTEQRKFTEIQVSKRPEIWRHGVPARRRLHVVVTYLGGFSDVETLRHKSAARLLEIVVNSQEFKDAVLKKSFTTTNKTPRQIYDLIMTGEEVLQKDVDYEMDVHVKIYHENNKTVGYTYPNTVQTWVNRKFFDSYELGQIAGNMFHEWMHKLGFSHISAKDYKSVPYSLGYLVTDMIRKWEAGTRYKDLYPDPLIKPIGKKVCQRDVKTLGLKKSCWYE